ncbi:hypothetical protein V6N12_000094 [Hibiscus sabdariffa]|uniref:Uncharacterized protein n=1 Tax=Hibiscus sabdariffa TaxID=183260 RepID=A0ABR2B7C0_9ROSI
MTLTGFLPMSRPKPRMKFAGRGTERTFYWRRVNLIKNSHPTQSPNLVRQEEKENLSGNAKELARATGEKGEASKIVLGHKSSAADNNKDRRSTIEVEESSSESSPISNRKEKMVSSEERKFGIDEGINVVCMGMSPHKYSDTQNREEFRLCREADLAWCSSNIQNVVLSNFPANEIGNGPLRSGPSKYLPEQRHRAKSWANTVLEGSPIPKSPSKERDTRALVDLKYMGFKPHELNDKSPNEMSLDEMSIDVQSLNTHRGVTEPNQGTETFVSEDRLEVEDIEAVIPFEEVPYFEIPEFNQKSKTKRVRRYGSLQDFQYKDDTILFLRQGKQILACVKHILRCSEVCSGLSFNFMKSGLVGFHVPTENLEDLAQICGCKINSLPFKYLGLLLGVDPRRLSTWDPMVDSRYL